MSPVGFLGGTSWWRRGFVALGTKLRSMTWVVNETSGRYVPGRLFGATSWGDGLCRVGDKAALGDMGSERDVRPLCPRSAFWCHELGRWALSRWGQSCAR